MAGPTGGARRALIVAGLIATGYFAALLATFLLSGKPTALPWDAALLALILVGAPISAATGLLIWRCGWTAAGDLAFRDDLTGLPNRRAFIADAEKALKKAMAGSIALILLDVDKLKMLNDTCGHQAGDELICSAAQQLSSSAAQDAAVYRVGGDEFAIIVNRARGGRMAMVTRSLESLSLRFRSCGHVHTVALSYGYASCAEGESFESLFKRTDERLYEHKDSSREVAQASNDAAPRRPRSSAAAMGFEEPERRLSLVHSRD